MDFSHLDEDQKKAVFSPSGFVRCMAGAGTGKTTTLEHKVAHLISEDYPGHVSYGCYIYK